MPGVSKDQLKLVGISCLDYNSESLTSSIDEKIGRSCETCTHWSGERCTIDVFDKVLTGLDQT
ncbi:hypothetical protein [Clostridium cylindrosporum]|uniref:Uncharacterized protein n=1 Tax=Clostridium cylindrosporum DSM 605 TaxID=1121307 RepID=A0A0J8DBX7_CLOCY|nr:hypothetical protein [Clostridium cylindrosporum]KMT23372.1 hypothetical protein CLCY_8c01090 [Clostridium cylindrosporum DSM 605]